MNVRQFCAATMTIIAAVSAVQMQARLHADTPLSAVSELPRWWNAESNVLSDTKIQKSGLSTPVITLTKHTTPSDRTRCGSCGKGCSDVECGTDCCSDCCTASCYRTCEPDHLFSFGIDATFLHAELNDATSSIRTFDELGDSIQNMSANVGDNAELNGAPRIWLGAERGCWGIRGRWFDYRAGDGHLGTPSALPDLIGISSHLRAYMGDIELTRKFCTPIVTGRFSFGARRASINSQTGVLLRTTVNPATVQGDAYDLSATADTDRSFDGNGIVMGIEGNKPIGDPCHGLTSISTQTPLSASNSNDFAVAGTDEAEMSIAEIQVGLQWTHQLECSCAIAFMRLGLEWQHWAGNSDVRTGSFGRSFANPGPEINAFANAGDQTLNLVGLAASAGFTY